jgi:hypothetical protein
MSTNQNKKRAREDVDGDEREDTDDAMDEEDAVNLSNGHQNPLGRGNNKKSKTKEEDDEATTTTTTTTTKTATTVKVEQLNQDLTAATNTAVSETLEDLPQIGREIYDALLKKNASDASGFVRSMRELQEKTFHDKDKVVSLIENKSEGIKRFFKQVKSQTYLKPDLKFPHKPPTVRGRFAQEAMVSERLKVEECFKKDTDDPKMKVNEYLEVVVATDGRMKGQLEVHFRKDLCAGTLIPWSGKYFLDSELNTVGLYEVQMNFHGRTIVLRPDKKGAACYTNDFAGPLPHRQENKRKYQDSYNLAMEQVEDHYGRPCT